MLKKPIFNAFLMFLSWFGVVRHKCTCYFRIFSSLKLERLHRGRDGFYSQSKASKVCKKVGPKMQRGDDEWERRFVLIVSPAIIFAVMPPPPPPPCRHRHPKLCKTFHGRPLPAAVTSSHWVRYAESSLILYKNYLFIHVPIHLLWNMGKIWKKKSIVNW